MITGIVYFILLWDETYTSEVYYYKPYNVTRSTISGIAEYRSALTLDWLVAEDQRQRELVAAFENDASPPTNIVTSECIAYAKPASGKVARLMLELLKNLEGDEGTLIAELIQSLIRAKLLVETSMLDAEPDLEALVKTPGVMAGEPHATFPRILAMVWMVACDPTTIKKHGWCPITKVTKYLAISKPATVAKHIRSLDSILARARFIMEEFIQHVTPISVYESNNKDKNIQGVYTKYGKNKVSHKQTTTRAPQVSVSRKVQRTSISIMEDPLENVAAYDQIKTPEAYLSVAAQSGLSKPSFKFKSFREKNSLQSPSTPDSSVNSDSTTDSAIKSYVSLFSVIFNAFLILLLN